MFGIWLFICVDSNAATIEGTFASTLSSSFKHCKRKTGWQLLKTKSYTSQSKSGPCQLQTRVRFWHSVRWYSENISVTKRFDWNIVVYEKPECPFPVIFIEQKTLKTILHKEWSSMKPLKNAKRDKQFSKLFLVFAFKHKYMHIGHEYYWHFHLTKCLH